MCLIIRVRSQSAISKAEGRRENMKIFTFLLRERASDREFFFSIFSTLYPYETQFLIKTARANRSIIVEIDKDEMIEVRKDMLTEFENLSVHPSKFIFK